MNLRRIFNISLMEAGWNKPKNKKKNIGIHWSIYECKWIYIHMSWCVCVSACIGACICSVGGLHLIKWIFKPNEFLFSLTLEITVVNSSSNNNNKDIDMDKSDRPTGQPTDRTTNNNCSSQRTNEWTRHCQPSVNNRSYCNSRLLPQIQSANQQFICFHNNKANRHCISWQYTLWHFNWQWRSWGLKRFDNIIRIIRGISPFLNYDLDIFSQVHHQQKKMY